MGQKCTIRKSNGVRVHYEKKSDGVRVLPRTGSSLGCAPGCDAGGREFETPTGPTLRVLK